MVNVECLQQKNVLIPLLWTVDWSFVAPIERCQKYVGSESQLRIQCESFPSLYVSYRNSLIRSGRALFP